MNNRAARPRQVMRRAASMLRPYQRGVVLGVLLILTYTATLLTGLVIVGYAIDEGLTPLVTLLRVVYRCGGAGTHSGSRSGGGDTELHLSDEGGKDER